MCPWPFSGLSQQKLRHPFQLLRIDLLSLWVLFFSSLSTLVVLLLLLLPPLFSSSASRFQKLALHKHLSAALVTHLLSLCLLIAFLPFSVLSVCVKCLSVCPANPPTSSCAAAYLGGRAYLAPRPALTLSPLPSTPHTTSSLTPPTPNPPFAVLMRTASWRTWIKPG